MSMVRKGPCPIAATVNNNPETPHQRHAICITAISSLTRGLQLRCGKIVRNASHQERERPPRLFITPIPFTYLTQVSNGDNLPSRRGAASLDDIQGSAAPEPPAAIPIHLYP